MDEEQVRRDERGRMRAFFESEVEKAEGCFRRKHQALGDGFLRGVTRVGGMAELEADSDTAARRLREAKAALDAVSRYVVWAEAPGPVLRYAAVCGTCGDRIPEGAVVYHIEAPGTNAFRYACQACANAESRHG